MTSDDTCEDQGETVADKRGPRKKENPVDRLFKKTIAHDWSSKGTLYDKRWSKAFHDAVLLYSDQQSLMGIAILVSGFAQLNCSLATYHWQLTFDLAWFSSMIHLTTLTCLRRYFQTQPALRIWRLICMAITALLLSGSLFSTGFIGQSTDPSFPARCLFDPKSSKAVEPLEVNHTYNGWYIGITFALLVISYMSRIVQLFPAATSRRHCSQVWPGGIFQFWLRKAELRANSSSTEGSGIFWALIYRIVLSVDFMLEAMSTLWSSVLWEVVSCLSFRLVLGD